MAVKIREFDNTTAQVSEYSNFAVVIPGFKGVPKIAEDKFDANGIIECSTQEDFINYVGFKRSDSNPAVTATVEDIKTEGETPVYNREFTVQDILKYQGNIYTEEELTPITGYENKGYRLRKVYNESKVLTNIYKYTKVEDKDLVAGSKYSVILSGNEGMDANTIAHYGNQMAFEMLGLGYTVLFKKIEKEDFSDMEKPEYWEALNDKSNYDFRYIVSGFIDTPVNVEKAIYTFTAHDPTGAQRNDCGAIIDIPSSNYTGDNKTQEKAIAAIKTFLNDSVRDEADRNVVFMGPWITYYLNRTNQKNYAYIGHDGNTYKYTDIYGNGKNEAQDYKFPGAFHYLTCAAKSNQTYAEWYAIAGYNRGICDFEISGTGIRLGDAAIAALQPRQYDGTVSYGLKRAANLIVNAHGQTLLWGNRTAEKLNSTNLLASHFLNVRQICYTLKKQIYLACKQLIFDPNSDLLWINFKNKIRPTLEKMKADQGIQDYEFVEKTTNDEGISERGKMYGIIRIVPIEAVEDFELDLYLEDSITTEE